MAAQAKRFSWRFSWRFADARAEAAFLDSRRERLLATFRLACVGMFATTGLAVLSVAQSWRSSGNIFNENYGAVASVANFRNCFLIVISILSALLAVGLGVDSAVARLGTAKVEVGISAALCLAVVDTCLINPWYLSNLWGLDVLEAFASPDLGTGFDVQMVMQLSLVVFASHMLLPVRWVVLLPSQCFTILCYLFPALRWGSPGAGDVKWNMFYLSASVACASVGRRMNEQHERAMFVQLAREKELRCNAESQLCHQQEALREMDDDGQSVPVTTVTGELFTVVATNLVAANTLDEASAALAAWPMTPHAEVAHEEAPRSPAPPLAAAAAAN